MNSPIFFYVLASKRIMMDKWRGEDEAWDVNATVVLLTLSLSLHTHTFIYASCFQRYIEAGPSRLLDTKHNKYLKSNWTTDS
jgi:hypothetical protein